MFSKRTWIAISVLMLGWAAWHGAQTFEYEYSRRPIDGGGYRISSVVCGTAPEIVFLGEYDEDIPGAATAADCRRTARSRILEVGGIVVLAVVVGFVGVRYGSSPPRPIDSELPRVPLDGDRTVYGRKRKDRS